MDKPTVWIFANGELAGPHALRRKAAEADLLIAADGGYSTMKRLGLHPHVLVGDLDSIDPIDLGILTAQGVEIERHPVDKDETDLELAINRALKAGAGQIIIAGALGGRVDMTLANILLLQREDLRGIDVRLDDGLTELFLVRTETAIHGEEGDLVSLLPLGEPAQGVLTSGLKYPLSLEPLALHKTRGVSNVMTGSVAGVSLRQGCLLCVHIRKSQVDYV